MEVTYENIVNGHILEYKDTLTIHGCRYEVCQSCFLRNSTGINDIIFTVLGIDKIKICEEYGMKSDGGFPFMKSFGCLTNLVRALYEMSPFKVGDKVRIKPIVGDGDDYPFYYADKMASHIGEIHTITFIDTTSAICNKKLYNGDPHIYRLDLDGSDCYYSWHSSMFELVVKGTGDWKKAYHEDGRQGVLPVDGERVLEYIPGYNRQRKETHIIL